jgi:hypothetical protein
VVYCPYVSTESVKLTFTSNFMLRLRMRGAIPPFPVNLQGVVLNSEHRHLYFTFPWKPEKL